MDFKKCLRCGAFFLSNSEVCPNCEPRDKADIAKIKNFIGQENSFASLNELSINTGVSINNLNRFVDKQDLNIQL